MKFTIITGKILSIIISLLAPYTLCGCGTYTSGAFWTDVDYDNENAYTVGGGETSERVTDIEVNWIKDVTINCYDGDTVKIEESADKEIEENLRLRRLVENGKLTIQFATNGRHDVRGLNKSLTVLIPENFALQNVDVNNVSGNIALNLNACRNLDIKNVSGDIMMSVRNFSSLSVNNVSGNINLSLPENFGFVLSIDIVSGRLETAFAAKKDGNVYTYLNGGANIKIESVAGNITLSAIK